MMGIGSGKIEPQDLAWIRERYADTSVVLFQREMRQLELLKQLNAEHALSASEHNQTDAGVWVRGLETGMTDGRQKKTV